MNFAPVDPPSGTATDEHDDTLPKQVPTRDHRSGTTIGNYVLQDRLGRGGMASVYRAVHTNLNEMVAIKILDPRFSAQPDMRRRFLREAVVMREISSNNRHVVRAIDFGTTSDGEAYMVMDHLSGTDLGELVKAVGPLEWSRLAPIALQLCDALAVVHARDLIHRDIKPSNCFLADDGGQKVAKLIDFGIAKDLALGGDLTDSNVVLGTPAYLAPEMLAQGVRPNPQTDIYALGATLYCLLTGRPPYTGRAHELIAQKQQTHRVLPPSAERPPHLSPLPRAVDELVMRAIHLDPDQRHRSVNELAEDIHRSVELAPRTSQLGGVGLAVRAFWCAVLVTGLAAATTIELAPAAVPSWSSGGTPLALNDQSIAEPAPAPIPDPGSVVWLEDSDTDTPPTGEPPEPVVSTTLPPTGDAGDTTGDTGNTIGDAGKPSSDPGKPGSEPGKPASDPDKPGSDPGKPSSEPGKPSSDPGKPGSDPGKPGSEPIPSKPPGGHAEPDAANQKIRRALVNQLDALRRECLPLSGGEERPRFTLVLGTGGTLEAVEAQPRLFRECVRQTLQAVRFGAAGRYSYSLKAK
jgi:hypothetical protein